MLLACSGETETVAPAAVEAVDVDCGTPGHPACPTQTWMKATLQAYFRSGDREHLATSMDALADHAPQGFEPWADIARAGAAAAREGRLDDVKASCAEWHADLRARFRCGRRNVPLFGPSPRR